MNKDIDQLINCFIKISKILNKYNYDWKKISKELSMTQILELMVNEEKIQEEKKYEKKN